MIKLDQIESAFRSAAKTVYRHTHLAVRNAIVLTDLDAEAATAYGERVRRFLSGIPGADAVDWRDFHGPKAQTVGDLLALVQEESPDLVVSYRNLYSGAWRWPYTLGDHVEVLTQVTDVPVLLLPRPDAQVALDEKLGDTDKVMAMTDHLTGDDRLVDYAVAFTQAGGRLFLAHVEDEDLFARYMGVISKVPGVDTETAHREIRAQLVKEPTDYIATVRAALGEAGVDLKVEAVVTVGHHLSVYRELVRSREIDLLVINTKDADQLAMHGLAYPLAVELRDVPLLML